jgi:hypothetical protein
LFFNFFLINKFFHIKKKKNNNNILINWDFLSDLMVWNTWSNTRKSFRKLRTNHWKRFLVKELNVWYVVSVSHLVLDLVNTLARNNAITHWVSRRFGANKSARNNSAYGNSAHKQIGVQSNHKLHAFQLNSKFYKTYQILSKSFVVIWCQKEITV